MPALLVALFLVAHGLVHASYVAPAPPPKPGSPRWPFDLAHSRLLTPLGLDETATRVVGLAMLVVVVAAFAGAAVAVLGVVPATWFPPMVVAGSITSIAMLVLFFHPWLVLGIVIDAVLLWAVLPNGWNPSPIA